MWASRPSYYDDDMPIDLRKKVVLQRDLEEQKESQRKENVFAPKENLLDLSPGRWHRPPALPVTHFYPFMSERYGGVRCSLVTSDENRSLDSKHGSRGTLETAIRKLHQNSQFKKNDEPPPKEERCRSTDTVLDNKDKDSTLESKRSSSCPDLTVIQPTTTTTTPPRPCKPSPLKPKSSFIQRSKSGYISDRNNTPTNYHHQDSHHPDYHHHHHNSNSSSQPPIIGGARKRKSFIPVYGDNRCASPVTKRRPRSPVEHHSPYDEYFSHPEVLLRRQLQQHDPSPYLVHVYDYYQQLVQRLRDNSSSNARVPPPPVSPTSADEDMVSDGGGNRKRPCRALTGKHVRQGTGASLSTLLTLRQKIQERQKAKEHQPRTGYNGICSKGAGMKKSKMQKAKENSKSLLLSKIQNC